MKQLANKIKHYLKVYLLLCKLSVQSVIVYRANALITGLAPVVWLLTVLVFINVIYSNVKELGGWNYWQVVFLTGIHEIIFLITWMTFATNLRIFIGNIVNARADQDFLRPINTKFLISFKTFDFTNIGSIINVIVIFIYSGSKIITDVNPNRIFGFFILIVIAFFVYYFLSFIISSLCLFIINAGTLFDWLFELTDFDRYPANIYSPTLRIIFLTFLPILFFSYVPTSYLFGKIGNEYILLGLVIVALLYFISSVVWKYGLKNYQSASN